VGEEEPRVNRISRGDVLTSAEAFSLMVEGTGRLRKRAFRRDKKNPPQLRERIKRTRASPSLVEAKRTISLENKGKKIPVLNWLRAVPGNWN